MFLKDNLKLCIKLNTLLNRSKQMKSLTATKFSTILECSYLSRSQNKTVSLDFPNTWPLTRKRLIFGLTLFLHRFHQLVIFRNKFFLILIVSDRFYTSLQINVNENTWRKCYIRPKA